MGNLMSSAVNLKQQQESLKLQAEHFRKELIDTVDSALKRQEEKHQEALKRQEEKHQEALKLQADQFRKELIDTVDSALKRQEEKFRKEISERYKRRLFMKDQMRLLNSN